MEKANSWESLYTLKCKCKVIADNSIVSVYLTGVVQEVLPVYPRRVAWTQQKQSPPTVHLIQVVLNTVKIYDRMTTLLQVNSHHTVRPHREDSKLTRGYVWPCLLIVISDCQKLLSSAGHFGFPAGQLIEFNRRPLPAMSSIFGNHWLWCKWGPRLVHSWCCSFTDIGNHWFRHTTRHYWRWFLQPFLNTLSSSVHVITLQMCGVS